MDNDGLVDILSQQSFDSFPPTNNSYNFNVTTLRTDGTFIEALSHPLGSLGWKALAPNVADLDGDNLLEMVALEQNGRITVWNTTAKASNNPLAWPMYRQNPRHTALGQIIENLPSLPARIQAQDYHKAFYQDPQNHGGACDRGDGVDMQTTNDNDGQCNIGWTLADETLSYQFYVEEDSRYDLILRLASEKQDRLMAVYVNGQALGTLEAPANGWQNFADKSLANLQLKAGKHTPLIKCLDRASNLNYLEFVKSESPFALPARIEEEEHNHYSDQ